MTYDFTTDPRMLAALNVRGLPGGDPDAMECSPPGPRTYSLTWLSGDLDANARELGVEVTVLVRARRALTGRS